MPLSSWPRRLPATILAALVLVLLARPAASQDAHSVTVAAVKYGGGGDWYQGQSPLPNLVRFVREETLIDVAPEADVVELTSDKLFSYPFVFLSGHGNVFFTDDEAQRLRRYLEGGGFLYVDDDYGLDSYFRRELKKAFPERELTDVPFSHPIYDAHFSFPNGLPKVHEHDGRAPQGFGLFLDGRLAVFYSYESNISDGWESPDVHQNPPEKRRAALQMGTNILAYALMH